jgi:hypothetical protein
MGKRQARRRTALTGAAYAIAGFLLGALTISLLLPLASHVVPTSEGPASVQLVNRAGKSGRLDAVSFNDRFAGPDFAPSRQLSDPEPLPSDSASNTTIVPKGAIRSSEVEPNALRREGEQAPTNRPPIMPRLVGCEPLASPIVDPVLARLSGRCVASLHTSDRRAVTADS